MCGQITLVAGDGADTDDLATTLDIPCVSALSEVQTPYALHCGEQGIGLMQMEGKKSTESRVDFISGAKAHRRKYGGGKGQALAKAVGLNKASQLSVIDATAGMGGDAFVLACLGCRVTLIERSPVVRLLLADGLARARNYADISDPELSDILQRMTLVDGDSLQLLCDESFGAAQVVYLDPMFPQRKKTAQVKKEMRFFHDIVGEDADADLLLSAALRKAENRVVVKRPKVAPYLAGKQPGYQLLGKSGRFDIYPLKAFDTNSC